MEMLDVMIASELWSDYVYGVYVCIQIANTYIKQVLCS